MAEKISAVIVTKNDRLRQLLEVGIAQNNNFEILNDFVDSSDLYNTLSSLTKSVLFVDFQEGEDFSVIENISSDCSGCKIVAIKENPDVSFIVRVVRAGAKEILSYPIIKSELDDLLVRICDQLNTPDIKQDKCKMISVFSNKGGIGKTSIAANLALELAQITKENVALIDLNFQLGDITTFMDLKPSFDISYMLKNPENLNKDFLLSTMEKYKNTSLYVLADPPYFKQAENIPNKNVAKLFEVLKESFSYIVVDTEASFDSKVVTALDYSDLILLVTIVNLPALRNCQRCLDLFSKLGYDDDKVQILINRYMENDEISIADVETLLKKNVYWKVPNNYFALMASINKGVLLSELRPDSNVAESYRELAMHVSDSVFRKKLLKKFSSDTMSRLDDIFRS